MNDIFRPHLRHFVLPFLEHAFGASRDCLTVARLSALSVFFGQSSVDYLDHIISAQGLAVNPDKIEVIQQWHSPKTGRCITCCGKTPTSGQRQKSRPLTLVRPNYFLLLSYVCLTLAKNFRLRLMLRGKALVLYFL
uniref:Reverse transcriptase domain-containing protein n=1 Tax=Solanum lycopersicum TaxID=4081 RepID=A0A3Q7GJP8_SOLLC